LTRRFYFGFDFGSYVLREGFDFDLKLQELG
jgi:hypothetical protein